MVILNFSFQFLNSVPKSVLIGSIVVCVIVLIFLVATSAYSQKKDFLKNIASKKKNTSGFLSLKELKEKLKEKKADIKEGENIRVAWVTYDKYIHIQWEKLKNIVDGSIIIYRSTTGLAQDCYDEKANGKMVVDEDGDVGVFKDYVGKNNIEKGVTYYYTVNYYAENARKTRYNITRPQIMLQEEDVQEEPQKTGPEKYREKKEAELEEHEIDLDFEHKKDIKKTIGGIKNADKLAEAENELKEEKVKIRVEEFIKQNPDATEEQRNEEAEKERKRLEHVSNIIRSKP